MQFYHKCKTGKMETLTATATQKIEVLSFSVDRGKAIPHISNLGGLGEFSIDKLVCRACEQEVPLAESFSSCMISGNNYPVTELVFSSGYVYHLRHFAEASDIIKAQIRRAPTNLLQFLLGGK